MNQQIAAHAVIVCSPWRAGKTRIRQRPGDRIHQVDIAGDRWCITARNWLVAHQDGAPPRHCLPSPTSPLSKSCPWRRCRSTPSTCPTTPATCGEHDACASRQADRRLLANPAHPPAGCAARSAVVARRIDPYCCGEGFNTLNTAPCGSVRTADRPTDGMSNGSTAICPPSAAALAAVASASSTAK
jgi:hypothetical protein